MLVPCHPTFFTDHIYFTYFFVVFFGRRKCENVNSWGQLWFFLQYCSCAFIHLAHDHNRQMADDFFSSGPGVHFQSIFLCVSDGRFIFEKKIMNTISIWTDVGQQSSVEIYSPISRTPYLLFVRDFWRRSEKGNLTDIARRREWSFVPGCVMAVKDCLDICAHSISFHMLLPPSLIFNLYATWVRKHLLMAMFITDQHRNGSLFMASGVVVPMRIQLDGHTNTYTDTRVTEMIDHKPTLARRKTTGEKCRKIIEARIKNRVWLRRMSASSVHDGSQHSFRTNNNSETEIPSMPTCAKRTLRKMRKRVRWMSNDINEYFNKLNRT